MPGLYVWICETCKRGSVHVLVNDPEDGEPSIELRCDYCEDSWDLSDIEALVTDEAPQDE